MTDRKTTSGEVFNLANWEVAMANHNATALGRFIFSEMEVIRVKKLFAPYSKADLRRFWDQVGDDSFYGGPEGSFDCADIHFYMNLTDDGSYCAV